MATTTIQEAKSKHHSSSSSLDSQSSNKLKSNDEIITEMASEFNKFLNLSVDKEEKRFHDSVEMMLTKLDEFFSLVDMIRSDTTLCLTSTVPAIQAKCAQMETIFEKIDRMEEFVSVVRDCVSATEEKVTQAEADMTAVGGLVKKITSFVSLKKSPTSPPGKKTEFTPAKIYNTEEYFPQSPQLPPQSQSSDASPSTPETTETS